ncbi:MAG: hypothetical protein HUJ56_08935 [Erysipelotrichaceae bacterium]|nr:hypothetical protein [Erysipelotrichaceae bacterium]
MKSIFLRYYELITISSALVGTLVGVVLGSLSGNEVFSLGLGSSMGMLVFLWMCYLGVNVK